MSKISESAPLLPPAAAVDVLPDVTVAIVLGAKITRQYKDGDGIYVDAGNQDWHLSSRDFEMANGIAWELKSELDITHVSNALDALKIRKYALVKIKKMLNFLDGKPSVKSVAMLKDKGSSGWWRMILPMEHMKKDGWQFDCTAAQVNFDHLIEYDTVFVQRIHDWESFYMLKKLKAAGVRLVYDIDDDLFNITPDNPAYHSITRDHQLAAANCMKLADVVTTTTSELQRRLTGVMDGVAPVVIPNSWDLDGWPELSATGSPDASKRILWSGGASHAEDWMECFGAIEQIMESRDDVRLLILGFLPPCVQQNAKKPCFDGRIEYLGFRDPETYHQIIHHVRAEVALAPLRSTGFNAAKSPIKFLEYASIGIPTVASNWLPYNDVIVDGESGRLVSGQAQWVEAITTYLDNKQERLNAIDKARLTCRTIFSVKRAASVWMDVLCR